MSAQARDILVRARELLVERGWFQGDFCDARGCLCGYGALWAACGVGFRLVSDGYIPDSGEGGVPDGVSYAAYLLDRAATVMSAAQFGFFPKWQDAKERTFDDVLKCFDCAIQLASEPATTEGAR